MHTALRGEQTAIRGWIPALDGIRGSAILMVMLFHYSVKLDRGHPVERVVGALSGYGWSGVDLFFVLSGFLITGILIDSRGAENYFSSFYVRRILRIFPAYYLCLGLFLLILPAIDPGWTRLLPAVHDRWLYVWYAQNWAGIFRFPGQAILTPYWSLAVEEQFYLVWPLVVAAFAGRKLLRVIVGAATFAVLLRFVCLAIGVSPEAIYANTLTRLDTLLIGAGCAVAVRDPAWLIRLRKLARWSWLAPLAPFVALQFVSAPHKTIHPGVQGIGFTAIGLSYAGLLLTAVLDGNRILHRFFTSRPMRLLGKYSYAAYLWHFPAMHFFRVGIENRIRVPGTVSILLMGALTLLLSVLSYYLVERWFLFFKKGYEPRRPAVSAIPATETAPASSTVAASEA